VNPATPSKLAGQRFGSLIAVKATTKRSSSGAILWLVSCDCGMEKQVLSTKLVSGKTRSCGCRRYSRESELYKGESGFNTILRTYRRSAKMRQLEFSLSPEHFKELTSSNCSYCAAPPTKFAHGTKGQSKEYTTYIYNGVDRIDNTLGYIPSNCVSCCTICNIAKHTMSISEFRAWINRVYINLNL
jgi:hypothetical protein